MGLPKPLVLYAMVAALVPGSRVKSTNVDPSETDGGKDRRRLLYDDRAQIGGVSIVAIVLAVLALIIVVFIMADFADPYFNATENITTAVDSASTGNDTIDNLMSVFSLLVAAVLTLGFIVLVINQINI